MPATARLRARARRLLRYQSDPDQFGGISDRITARGTEDLEGVGYRHIEFQLSRAATLAFQKFRGSLGFIHYLTNVSPPWSQNQPTSDSLVHLTLMGLSQRRKGILFRWGSFWSVKLFLLANVVSVICHLERELDICRPLKATID